MSYPDMFEPRSAPFRLLFYDICVCVKLLFSLLTKGKIVRYWNVCFIFSVNLWRFEQLFRRFVHTGGKKDHSKPGLQSAIAVGASLTVFLCSVTEKIEMKTIIKTETVRNGTLIACCDCAVKSFVSAGVFRILAL